MDFLKAPDMRTHSLNDLLLFDEIKDIERIILTASNEGRFDVEVMTSIMTDINYIPTVEATTVVSMMITEITNMIIPGTNYAVDDELTIVGGSTVGIEFAISGMGIINGGLGYTTGDQLLIDGGEYTTQAILEVDTVDVNGTILTALVFTSGVYTDFPLDPVSTIKISGAGNNKATFNLAWTAITNDVAKIKVDAVDISTGEILEYSILERGEYTSIPANTVSVTGGLGSNATFDLEWGVKYVHVVNHGSGYLLPPEVEFSSGNALAISTPLIGTMIDKIMVTNTGYGYLEVPTVYLNPRGLAEDYYNTWKSIDTHRVRQDQMNKVIKHFEDKGYTIVRVLNPITGHTFKWVLNW